MPGRSVTPPRSLLYPIGLKLGGRRCLVVGSGDLARRKAQELIDCGALVHVIEPDPEGNGVDGADTGGFSRSGRPFVPSDLDSVHLVVVAGTSRQNQEAVARAADERGIPCNVVDVNDLCSFYAPAILRVGSLTISVATDGKSPLLAVAIRDRIARSLDDAVGPALEMLGEARELASARYPENHEQRVAALRRLLSEPALNAIVSGRLTEFEEHWVTWKNNLTPRP